MEERPHFKLAIVDHRLKGRVSFTKQQSRLLESKMAESTWLDFSNDCLNPKWSFKYWVTRGALLSLLERNRLTNSIYPRANV